MIALIKSICHEYFETPSYNICILGTQQTGKTVLFNTIKYIHEPQIIVMPNQNKIVYSYKPTIGLNVLRYRNNNDQFMVWDLGGRANIRKIWENYYSQCHGLIFLINGNIEEGIQTLSKKLFELEQVLTHQQMTRIPIGLIVGDSMQKQQVQIAIKKHELERDRKIIVHELSITKFASSKALIRDLLHWLYFNIRQLHLQLKD